MTTIPAVLAALTALAADTLPGWQIINGPVGSVTTTGSQLVLVGDEIIPGRRDLDSMSLETSSEQYTVPMMVNVDIAGTDQLQADGLALAAYESLERAIREHPAGPTLGLPGVLQALPLDDFSLRRQADENGRHAAVRFSVFILAQNT